MNFRPRIVLCSLLKPVDDPRMYERLAKSLNKIGRFEIVIIGHDSGFIPADLNISFLPLFQLKRNAMSRIFMPLKLFLKLIKLKPKVIINNSIDFQLIICFYKSISKCLFIYDVQENYYYNILHNRYIPIGLRRVLATSVRLIERLTKPFVDYYLLAESTYQTELKFIGKNFITLENKYAFSFESDEKFPAKFNGHITLLFSGTIAGHYGIFDIVDFVEEFHLKDPGIILEIIGYCPHTPTLRKLEIRIRDLDFIHLTGGNRPVSHHAIINAIRKADFGIINYHINPSTENRFPTRIYEYLANKLPILIQDHKPWRALIEKFNAGIVVDFKSPDFDRMYELMNSLNFYDKDIDDTVFWKDEERRLIELIERLA